MGKRPFAKILPGEWYDLFAAMKERGIAEQTRRTRQLCVEIYDWAVIQHRIDFNPLDRLAKFVKGRSAENYDDGLLQRFGMLVWPDVAGEWRNVGHTMFGPIA